MWFQNSILWGFWLKPETFIPNVLYVVIPALLIATQCRRFSLQRLTKMLLAWVHYPSNGVLWPRQFSVLDATAVNFFHIELIPNILPYYVIVKMQYIYSDGT